MAVNSSLLSLFTEQAVAKKRVTNITILKSVITLHVEAKVESAYVRPDCQRPVAVHLPMYFLIDRNQSLPATREQLHELSRHHHLLR